MASGPNSQTILVVGGGIAGITAALEAAECGHDVRLLEQGPNQNTIRSAKLEDMAKKKK